MTQVGRIRKSILGGFRPVFCSLGSESACEDCSQEKGFPLLVREGS